MKNTPPTSSSEHVTPPADSSQIKLLRALLIVTILADIGGFVTTVTGGYGLEFALPLGIFLLIAIGSLVALRRGISFPARVLLPAALYLMVTAFLMFPSGYGLHDINLLTYSLVISLASLTLGQPGIVAFTALVILAVFGIGIAEMRGILVSPTSALTLPVTPFIISIIVLAIAFILRALINLFNETLRRAQQSEQEVAKRNAELQTFNVGLEQTVHERTASLEKRAAQLQTIAELAQAISQVQNPNEIFSAASKLISERFGFYHVGIFLTDHDRENVVLQAANSEGGQKMLARGHRLALGTGVVGFAAQTGKPRIALDVGADAVFFNNPDLPDTRSEIALPLSYGEQAIGVLDVQSVIASAFSEDDFRVLGTLANQLAIAIENVRLLSEARASAKQVEEVYNAFVRTQWSRTNEKLGHAGFRYNAGRIEMLEPAADEGAASNSLSAGQLDPSAKNRGSVAVPVKLRGETIGMLNIEAHDPLKQWRADEVSLVEAVAERAALAMENARLFQDARRRAAKERMIAEATSHITSSMNIENILQATAAELERVLGGSEVVIQFNKDAA